MAFPYATPQAFRAAVRDRFAALVRADPRLSIDQLQRQFAYDRLLARCFTGEEATRWVLKGAGALLARLEGMARHSKDIDLYYTERAASVERAVDALTVAADRDLGDHFRFEITGTSLLQEEARGRRVHLVAYLGGRYAAFHVDVVVDTAMSGEPDTAPPLTPLVIEGLPRPPYRVFPVTDHVADKLCAVVERHDRPDGRTDASTRVKDLVDIAIVARSQSMDAQHLRTSLLTGAAHRGLPLPPRFDVPDVDAWRTGYARRAADAPIPVPGFAEAVDLARRLLDPVLAGPLEGMWDPDTGDWRA